MGQTLTLHLVNDLGSDSVSGSQSDVASQWPGVPVEYEFAVPPQAVRAVWIGVSADGLSNQPYPLTTSVATILGDGWTRVYQGVEIVGTDGDVQVFSDQQGDVLRRLAACCTSQVLTQALALLQSRYGLNPDQPEPPCGAEAIFKLLGIVGSAETRTLNYQWGFELLGADGDLDNLFDWSENGPLPATQQLVHAWPAGFYGIVETVSHSRFLVADDDSTTDPNAVPVGFYAGGTITLNVVVYDPDDETYIFSQTKTFRLPATDCSGGQSSSAGESDSGSASASLPPVGFVPNLRAQAVVTVPGQIKSIDFDTDFDTTGWVNWGDGTPDEPIIGGGGEFVANHAYADVGTYPVQMRVDDPSAPHGLQIAGDGPNQVNAHEFLVPFPAITAVNMTAGDLTAFSCVNLPAVVDLTFNFCNFTQAALDQIIQDLDDFAPDNGSLLVTDQGTGAIPNTIAGPYLDLTTFRGWTITHD